MRAKAKQTTRMKARRAMRKARPIPTSDCRPTDLKPTTMRRLLRLLRVRPNPQQCQPGSLTLHTPQTIASSPRRVPAAHPKACGDRCEVDEVNGTTQGRTVAENRRRRSTLHDHADPLTSHPFLSSTEFHCMPLHLLPNVLCSTRRPLAEESLFLIRMPRSASPPTPNGHPHVEFRRTRWVSDFARASNYASIYVAARVGEARVPPIPSISRRIPPNTSPNVAAIHSSCILPVSLAQSRTCTNRHVKRISGLADGRSQVPYMPLVAHHPPAAALHYGRRAVMHSTANETQNYVPAIQTSAAPSAYTFGTWLRTGNCPSLHASTNSRCWPVTSDETWHVTKSPKIGS
ncbi:hypothetical protein B0H12DRAFT_1240603 [Mycena haematopus]|nr:hypothetical protein B0H12DRAFT_1240603 [Mycena haematopus]